MKHIPSIAFKEISGSAKGITAAITSAQSGRAAAHFNCVITQLTILSLKQSHSVLSLQNNAYICTVIHRKRITDILVKVFSHYPTEEI